MQIIGCFLAAVTLLFSQVARAEFTVTATKTELLFRFDTKSSHRSLAELAPYQSASNAASLPPLVADADGKKVIIPRFDGSRDRIYSGFVALQNGVPEGLMRFVEAGREISKFQEPYPHTRSKKGLQVQMPDDAIALGVQHAAFNIDIGSSVKLTPDANDLAWESDGRTFWFSGPYIRDIDREVRTMSDTGATVTLILLNYSHPGLPANAVLQHPDYDTNCPGHISEFNTSTPEGLAWFKAWVEFLADRYSAPDFLHGRVVNYIVGNEVNAHWDWANMGNVTVEQFTPDYQRAVRVCSMAVRKASASDRVFVSLEHDWNKLFAEANDRHGFPGRKFLDLFNQLAKTGGDFEWNLAFHPYPEDLFNCRTWEDESATFVENTPRLTFKNIEMLPHYLRRRELLYHGEPRHIILSEQGFHAKPTPQGDLEQAAAYCFAWRKIVNLKGVDAFILHRQVDNGGEGGLNLGLWRREPDSVCTPSTKRPMYNVFCLADTPYWKQAFEFALPIIGIDSWDEINSR